MAGIVRQTPSNPFARGGILAVAAAVTFGATTPVVKRLGMNVGPFPTAMLLYAGAALASVRGFGPRRSHEASLRPQNALRVLAVALAGALFAPVCLAWGLQHTSGASASLLLNFEAAFTVLLGWRLYHEHLGRRIVLALTLMLAGGACLAVAQQTSSQGLGWGAFAVVLAALGWAADNALTRPLADFDPIAVVRWKSAFGAIFALALAIGLRERFPDLANVAGLLICGAVGYGVSLRLYLLAQRHVGAGRTGSIFALAPFIGASVAWAMGDRSVGFSTLVAALLFGAGVCMHLTEKHRHGHSHEPTEHEHAHEHDDGHHDHPHDPVALESHSHRHRHDARKHDHPHGPDAHHQHRHDTPKACFAPRVDSNMRTTKLWAVLTFVAVSGVTYSASADPTKIDDNYVYVFKDPDLLSGDASVVTAVPIFVQKHLRREVLLRPRIQFVTEMLKSVEGL